jgi:AcrR family transcriptional regulator
MSAVEIAEEDSGRDESICAKAAQIIAAAREAFLDQGYDAISMDEVARRASVAKQTVYSHFAGKEALFLAVVKREQQAMKIALPTTDGHESVRDTLASIGRRYIDKILNPEIRCVFRLAVAESTRFPSLGRSIREAGPRQTVLDLAALLAEAIRSNRLEADDPVTAAEQFLALARGELYIDCLLDPEFHPDPKAVDRQLEGALDCFLARYPARNAA